MAALLVVAVIAVAYGTKAPSLGVAEFAPSAQQQVEPPPTSGGEQASSAGAGGRRRASTTTTAVMVQDPTGSSSAAPTTRVGRARNCFGNPPRQTFDPRSPACQATMFEGDNGGSTSKGVGPSEVRIAMADTPSVDDKRRIDAMFEHFNQSFEFYGRRLVPIYVKTSGSSGIPEQRADAVSIASNDVFATVGSTIKTFFPAFSAELARQGVLSILYNTTDFVSDREVLDELHPYVWSVLPSSEQIWRNLSNMICTSLANRPASHAGPSLDGKTRKFAVLVAGKVRLPSVRVLADELRRCDADPVVAEAVQKDNSTDWQNRVKVALEGFKADGATTIICACADLLAANVASLMDDVNYVDAEWMLPSFSFYGFEEWYLQNQYPNGLRQRVFGLQPMQRVSPVQGTAWLDAARSVDPTVTPDQGYMLAVYERLLVLASGIQGAGPNLNPETFAAGLMASNFPNSDAGKAPYWLPSVGFGPGDHSFFNDYALAWWSDTATPFGQFPSSVGGSWCYLGAGTRYQVGSFPADADSRFFNPAEPCR